MNAPNHKGERIAKRMARAGLCSRRDAERWITAGRVNVNGKTLETPACVVNDQDTILVDGKPLNDKQATRLFLYHKPAGLVTSHKDEQGRKTVFQSLPKNLPRVISIGRLDLNSEGLLLLTNDGELSRYLELPTTGWRRQYRVRVHGQINDDIITQLKKGVRVEGIQYKRIDVHIEKSGTNSWLHITLTEGKNREIRRVMDHFNLPVSRLIRIAYGPFKLEDLKEGDVTEIPAKDINRLIPKFQK